jgi:beta-lactamase regulating signal transducer with metallopeptidase domain
MTDFLLVLAKTNLAMIAAILMVALLRRPVRAGFGAGLAYALWLLVPVAALASLLPPREGIEVPPAASVIPDAAHIAHNPIAQSMIAVPVISFRAALLDNATLLFAGWLLGVVVMALYLAWLQARFHRAARSGEAGPAVAGVLRPRLVMPKDFGAIFSLPEQAAILAHEEAHLARHDARINALAALLRALCWFNPLIHPAAGWLRADQELACDEAVMTSGMTSGMTGAVSRRDYARALLKSQIATPLPLGCTWPGSEHPLTERIALLKRKPPGKADRIMGAGLIALAASCAGLGVWAAQPAQAQSKSFTGKIFYAERQGENKSGQAYFLSLESGQDDKFSGGRDKRRRYEVMHFPYGFAQADSAASDLKLDADLLDHKTVTMTGNVKLFMGEFPDGLRGAKLTFDARTGMLDLDGRILPSGMPKYVPCAKDCRPFGN